MLKCPVTNKTRRSAYSCTPSSYPKQSFGSFRLLQGIFPIPYKKAEVTNEARRSAYPCTPSGYPKQSFGSFRPLQGIFPIPYKKAEVTNEARHSAYSCTPSGNPKQKLWLVSSVTGHLKTLFYVKYNRSTSVHLPVVSQTVNIQPQN